MRYCNEEEPSAFRWGLLFSSCWRLLLRLAGDSSYIYLCVSVGNLLKLSLHTASAEACGWVLFSLRAAPFLSPDGYGRRYWRISRAVFVSMQAQDPLFAGILAVFKSMRTQGPLFADIELFWVQETDTRSITDWCSSSLIQFGQRIRYFAKISLILSLSGHRIR